MQRHRQRKVVEIDKGLVVVRYTGAEDEARPPNVSVTVNPKHAGFIELVSNPLYPDARLWQPGSGLVVRAAQAGQLFVEVEALEPGGSTAATVQVEALGQGGAPVAVTPAAVAPLVAAAVSGLTVTGHVAGIGDVTVPADAWIAGPQAPARIEGLAIQWPGRPAGLDLHYHVRTAKPAAMAERRIALGGFAGTRGRALPVTGLVLTLSGAASADYRLEVEAAFLGAPLQRMQGRAIDLAGPTGREPLVGLRLRVDALAPAQPVAPPPVTREGGVRVFRSRAATDGALARAG
jgi:hypothetical protein